MRIKSALAIKKLIENGDLSAAYGSGNISKIVQMMRDDSHDLVSKLGSISEGNLVPEVDEDSPEIDYATMLLLLLKTRPT